jgi:hypothetical protein
MRQRRRVELLNDYDCEIRYHPGKANVVADALSRKERVKVRRIRALGMAIQSSLTTQIRDAQVEALKEENLKKEGLRGMDEKLESKSDGTRYFMDRIRVPNTEKLRGLILDEAHKSGFSIHPGSDVCPSMKGEIATYVRKCLTCAKVKAEYQKASGLLQ